MPLGEVDLSAAVDALRGAAGAARGGRTRDRLRSRLVVAFLQLLDGLRAGMAGFDEEETPQEGGDTVPVGNP